MGLTCLLFPFPTPDWLHKHKGNLPTVEQIENVWNLPDAPPVPDTDSETKEEKTARESSPEFKEYAEAVELLTWWMDHFMPMAVGLEFWGPNIRCFCLMTEKAIVDGDVSGKEKVLVTATSEAFAYLLYANCRDKWIVDYKYLMKNGRQAKIPQYKKDNPETHKHKNKWSNSNTGSVQGGGWDKAGLKYFMDMVDKVTKFREEEEQDGNTKYKMVKELLQVVHRVKMEDAQEPDSAAGKKQKRGDDGAEKKKEFKIIYIDE